MSDGADVPGGSSGSFDDIQAQLDALIQGFGGEVAVRAPAPVREPAPEPEPEPEPEPAPEPASAEPPAERTPVVAPLLASVRRILAERRSLLGAAAIAVVVIGLLVVVLQSQGDRSNGGTPSASSVSDSTAGVRFPETTGDVLAPDGRIRPVGVRSLELGFEAAVVPTTDLPACASHDPDLGRAVWFDAPADSGTSETLPVAVAPGEHGVALLLADARGQPEATPFAGIGAAGSGDRIEVARANGTIMTWRAIDVVRVAVGSDLPVEVLVPAAEQRLLLVGCGALVDDEERDVYVLALRDR